VLGQRADVFRGIAERYEPPLVVHSGQQYARSMRRNFADRRDLTWPTDGLNYPDAPA
jgi:hypothetical protein